MECILLLYSETGLLSVLGGLSQNTISGEDGKTVFGSKILSRKSTPQPRAKGRLVFSKAKVSRHSTEYTSKTWRHHGNLFPLVRIQVCSAGYPWISSATHQKRDLVRASQATIDMRQKEFRALIEALFSDEMPSLIQEIRASTIVSDFFGLWRRDYEHMDPAPRGARSSVTSSVFSTYFSESSSSLSVRSTRTSSSSDTTPSSLPNSPARGTPDPAQARRNALDP